MTAHPPKVPRPRKAAHPKARRPARRAQRGGGVGIGTVHLTAEYWPLARTGGLGEAVQGLAGFQAAMGQPTTVLLPLYRSVRSTAPDLERVGPPFSVTFGGRSEEAWLHRIPRAPHTPDVFLIEHPEYFDRDGIYGADGADYPDNARRFAFFCLAALTALPQIAPDARVLHAHDWHTALAPVYLRTAFAGQAQYNGLATVLSVHNAGFQGHFPPTTVTDLGFAAALYAPRVFEWYGRMNLLQGGLAYSDAAVTVSPTHARELCTPEGGFGLHEMFTAMGARMVGILNGIDADLWDPATDPVIIANYSPHESAGKHLCKAALQRATGLPERADVPLFGMSARLVSQKGLDIVLAADLLAMSDLQLVFLGAGEHRYQHALAELARANPDRVAVEFNFTDRLEHRLLAGADALVMPSLYEPCGLTQMRAQRYGTIPLARRVGGLADSIEDGVTGLLFDEYSAAGLTGAFERALQLYRQPAKWRALVRRAMAQPLGWQASANRYQEVYASALAPRSGSR
ncbi:MAG TPA: glycogen synthase [Gemmatimonadales bacterium]|nr:glycogen synthase [Gemmatimonadales bacterium]